MYINSHTHSHAEYGSERKIYLPPSSYQQKYPKSRSRYQNDGGTGGEVVGVRKPESYEGEEGGEDSGVEHHLPE